MSEQSLRDALEKLASKWEARHSTPAGFYPEASAHAEGLDGGYEGAADDLRELLAAHPVEPAPVFCKAVSPTFPNPMCSLLEGHSEPHDTVDKNGNWGWGWPTPEPAGVSDEAVGAARLAYSEACKDGRHLDGAGRFRAALEAAQPFMEPQVVASRDSLAKAAHAHFCLVRDEPTHDPDEIDYDKADEILEILARLDGAR